MLDSAHFFARCLRYRLHTESLQLRTLANLRLRGATVLDIGANKGIYSFWLSRAVGSNGRVLAFEPQPEMVKYIDAKRSLFRLGNVSIYNTALSTSSGTAALLRQRIGDGSASLQPDRVRDDSQEIRVEVRSLDDFEEASNVAFIKCDVEGHEIKVFEGARRLLERDKPVV
ncbi:FkbM family methyltransferase, partial [Enterococcus entomosocium]|uniref:FkbM family methyltransferase n=1 Tax=Enterococcus entomosocium TaxID=3034352 RepID=UPI002649DAB4